MPKQTYDFDLIVIGSGAAGSIGAHIAARAGKRVAIVENGAYGGDYTNWGDVPTKALLYAARVYDEAKRGQALGLRTAAVGYNYPSVKAWKDMAVQRTGASKAKQYYEAEGIAVLKGQAHFISPHEITLSRRHISSAHFLIASGSAPILPDVSGLEQTGYLTSREAIDLIRPPKSLFIIGAGTEGCEFAQLFSTFGTKVYLADIAPRILPAEDNEVSDLMTETFTHERGMEILTSAKVVRTAKEGLLTRVTYQRGGVEAHAKVEHVLIACGKEALTDFGLENAGVQYDKTGIGVTAEMQTSAKHIYAAGDVVGPYRLTHMAIYQSRVALHNLFNRDKVTVNYKAVPRIAYLVPEVASVGMSEAACIKRDLPIKKGVAPLSIVARANMDNFKNGFVKVIALRDGTLLGATVVCPHAGEVIHELSLAIQYGIKARDVAATLHAFPSWSEAVRAACGKI